MDKIIVANLISHQAMTSSNNAIIFTPEEKTCAIRRENSVLEVALRNGVDISHSCGGMGSCGTCRVFLDSPLDLLPSRPEVEQEMADQRGFAVNERLACQLPPLPGLKVRVPPRVL